MTTIESKQAELKEKIEEASRIAEYLSRHIGTSPATEIHGLLSILNRQAAQIANLQDQIAETK